MSELPKAITDKYEVLPNAFRQVVKDDPKDRLEVEIGDEKHYLSRKSIRFFEDWVDERIKKIKIEDSKKLEEVLKYHRKAKQFWQQRLSLANAD